MSKNYAITVGINEYYNLQSLRSAKRDAELMQDFLLNEVGFDQVFHFSDDSLSIKGDYGPEIRTQPTFGNFRRFLNIRFKEPFMSPEDHFWFFFSGHGIRFNERDYLMLCDTDPGDIEATAIPISFVLERLRCCGANNIVLFLDACRNTDKRRKDGQGFGNEALKGVISFFACSPTEFSYEINKDDFQSGIFTYALLQGFRTLDRNKLVVERFSQYLMKRVAELCIENCTETQKPYCIVEPIEKSKSILLPRKEAKHLIELDLPSTLDTIRTVAAFLTPDLNLWVGADNTGLALTRFSPISEYRFGNAISFAISDFLEINDSDNISYDVSIEGIAYSDNYLWLTSSHRVSRKRPRPRSSDRDRIERLASIRVELENYLIARIPLVNGQLFRTCPDPQNPDKLLTAANLQFTEHGNLLIDALKYDPHIGNFIDALIPGRENGFGIESIATCGRKLFLGLYGPTLDEWSIILEIEVEESSVTNLQLKTIGEEGEMYRKHFINLGGLRINDLCIDSHDLLILAGPPRYSEGGFKLFQLKECLNLPGNTLFYPGAELMQVLEIPNENKESQIGAITSFSAITDRPSVLVLYNSPAQEIRRKQANVELGDILIWG